MEHEARNEPLRNQVGEYIAQAPGEVRGSEAALELVLELCPRFRRLEELAFRLACLDPSDAGGERERIRLLHGEPAVVQRFVLVLDEPRPTALLAARDAIGLRQDTCVSVELVSDVVREVRYAPTVRFPSGSCCFVR